MAKASQWVAAYTNVDAHRVSARPYAYPAYDNYTTVDETPVILTDADLLAPTLLNVTVKIRSYYALQDARERLQEGLRQPSLGTPLAELPNERIDALVGGLYSVLDDGLWGVRATTLSKILHRKRPASVALHDTWVRACYVSDDGPVLPVRKGEKRSWSEYMAAVSRAMAVDLRQGAAQFEILQRASLAQPSLTDLRLLDILAWNVGRLGAAPV